MRRHGGGGEGRRPRRALSAREAARRGRDEPPLEPAGAGGVGAGAARRGQAGGDGRRGARRSSRSHVMTATAQRNVVAAWGDAHRYSPAPRHRRRLVVSALRGLGVTEVLDAGCGQPFLLEAVRAQLGVPCYGCDISDAGVEDPAWAGIAEELRVVDLERETWPDGRTFDAVVCGELLEHIGDWRAALRNVAAMTRRHLLVTVPGGRRRPMDAIVGHHRHFTVADIADALRAE